MQERERRGEKCNLYGAHSRTSQLPLLRNRLVYREVSGDGELPVYIITSSAATHTFVFIGRRRGGKATDGTFGPVRSEISWWKDIVSQVADRKPLFSVLFPFSSLHRTAAGCAHGSSSFLRSSVYLRVTWFEKERDIRKSIAHQRVPTWLRQSRWVSDERATGRYTRTLCTRTPGDLKFRSIRRGSLCFPLSFSPYSRRHGIRSMLP